MKNWKVTHRLKCLVNNIRVREVVIGKEVELVQKIPNVNTTKRIHLGEGQHAREARRYVSIQCFKSSVAVVTYVCSSRGFSGVYQLTLMTLSNSSRF